MSDALGPGGFNAFINWLYSSGDISIPIDYHERCQKITSMLDDDISGVVNTVLDYAVNSASEAKYRVECSEITLQKLLNLWLDKVNLEVRGIPTGLESLSKEYFKERWEGSSFCVLRVDAWEEISADNVTIEVPTIMWFVNGSSIYVVRPKDKNYKLGSDKFYLDQDHKIVIPSNKEENIVIQKPFNRWFDKYATPYVIRKGILKSWLAIKTLQDKSDEVLSKFIPYLFVIEKGTENLFLQGDVNYTDEELKSMVDNFKKEIEKYRNQKGKTPTTGVPFDQKYSHLIPDLRNILTEELYRQGYRTILAGLGFVDMLEIAPSRQESRLNPKAFISEINDGVNGFKSILLEVILLIEQRNKKQHPKLFNNKGKLIIVNSPLRINVEQILDALRSGYDRGVTSIESYQEILGLDPKTEKERRLKELENGDEDLFYPHLIQNREDIPDRMGIPAKPRKETEEKNEDQNKKKNTPESDNFKADLNNLIVAPYDKNNPPAFLLKYPEGAINVFIEVFNENLPKGEDYAFPVAWTALKRWLKKHGYKKDGNKWVKKSQADIKAEMIEEKKNQLLDKLLKEKDENI